MAGSGGSFNLPPNRRTVAKDRALAMPVGGSPRSIAGSEQSALVCWPLLSQSAIPSTMGASRLVFEHAPPGKGVVRALLVAPLYGVLLGW